MAENILMELNGIAKSFRSADGGPRLILDDVNFSLAKGEIVALLGKSGSGKSTLLRIMAGLIPADIGKAIYRGKDIRGPATGVAMVFQSFALFPWLTVQQNVELGLEAQGIAPAEREKRADAMLELMGLAGFGGVSRQSDVSCSGVRVGDDEAESEHLAQSSDGVWHPMVHPV